MMNYDPSTSLGGTTLRQDAEGVIAELEMKLNDTVELLHLWKNEACAFRHLTEALVAGRFSLEEAKTLLACPNQFEAANECEILNEKCEIEGTAVDFEPFSISHLLFNILSVGEREAFLAAARKAELSPAEFLWACVESMMNSSDDEDVLRGCREAAHRRFREGKLSEWLVV